MGMNAVRLLKPIGLAVILLVAALAMNPVPAFAQGDPAFNIDSWSLQLPEGKAELERGMEFGLTVTFTNVGSAGANEVLVSVQQNQNFVALGTGPRFGHMGIGAQATTTIRVAVSNTIETGYYNIPVEFNYHHTMLGGARRTDVKEIGVHVIGLSPFRNQPDTGSPKLVIESSNLQVAGDGSTLLLTLVIRNVGNRLATNIVVNLDHSEVFSPAEGSSSAFGLEGDINVDQVAVVTMPLVLIQSPGERVTQDFTIEYNSYSGGTYRETQSVPIVLGEATAQTPRLLLERYSTTPEVISPGATIRLSLDLVNVGSGPARQVFVRLGKDSATLGPLAPLGSGNITYLEEVAAGSRVTVNYDLVADGDAQAGLVAIDVEMEYDDLFGVKHTETVTISLQVVTIPYFQIGLFDTIPEPIYVGQVFELPIEVINIGRSMVNVSIIEVVSNDLQISEGTMYVGPLDGGTSGSLVASAEALTPGTATVEVRVHYLDSFQQPQVITETLTFEIQEGGPLPEEGEGAGPVEEEGELTFGQRLWRVILGFLGLGTRPLESSVAPGGGGQGGGVEIRVED